MGLLKRKKKVVKATAKEQKIIGARLRRAYPQMYQPLGWSIREQKAYDKLSVADKKAIAKMSGSFRLKKIYR